MQKSTLVTISQIFTAKLRCNERFGSTKTVCMVQVCLIGYGRFVISWFIISKVTHTHNFQVKCLKYQISSQHGWNKTAILYTIGGSGTTLHVAMPLVVRALLAAELAALQELLGLLQYVALHPGGSACGLQLGRGKTHSPAVILFSNINKVTIQRFGIH